MWSWLAAFGGFPLPGAPLLVFPPSHHFAAVAHGRRVGTVCWRIRGGSLPLGTMRPGILPVGPEQTRGRVVSSVTASASLLCCIPASEVHAGGLASLPLCVCGGSCRLTLCSLRSQRDATRRQQKPRQRMEVALCATAGEGTQSPQRVFNTASRGLGRERSARLFGGF